MTGTSTASVCCPEPGQHRLPLGKRRCPLLQHRGSDTASGVGGGRSGAAPHAHLPCSHRSIQGFSAPHCLPEKGPWPLVPNRTLGAGGAEQLRRRPLESQGGDLSLRRLLLIPLPELPLGHHQPCKSTARPVLRTTACDSTQVSVGPASVPSQQLLRAPGEVTARGLPPKGHSASLHLSLLIHGPEVGATLIGQQQRPTVTGGGYKARRQRSAAQLRCTDREPRPDLRAAWTGKQVGMGSFQENCHRDAYVTAVTQHTTQRAQLMAVRYVMLPSW